MEANKKHDKTHFKYQTFKLKIREYERLKETVLVSKISMNAFLREAIANKVNYYVPPDDCEIEEEETE